MAFAVAMGQGKIMPYRHVRFIADKIQKAMETADYRLMLCLPPRHGKTNVSVVNGGAWYLKEFPDNKFGYAAHTQTLADKWSRKARETFGRCPYGQALAPEAQGVKEWSVADHDGSFMGFGIDGPVTGSGFNFLVIDDPIKNQAEAYSAVLRNKIYEYYTDTLLDRMESGGSICIIMHRWHEDDLIGRILKDGDDWDVVKLPAIAGEDDLLGRDEGEALWPAKYPIKSLNRLKRAMGSKTFEAKFQSNPIHLSGALFKPEWFRYFDLDGDFIVHADGKRVGLATCLIFQTVDPAGTEGKKSDYFVCTTFAQDTKNLLYILDVYRVKADTTRHQRILDQQRDRWKPSAQYVEKVSFGINIIQKAKADGLPLRKLEADKSKRLRAEDAITFYENGMVFHRRNASWLPALEDELSQFPNGEHDDQVDTVSYGAIIARQRKLDWRKRFER